MRLWIQVVALLGAMTVAAAQAPAVVPGERIVYGVDPSDPYTGLAPNNAHKGLHGELFRPRVGKPGSWPGIVVIPGAGGLNDQVRTAAHAFADAGFQVLAVDLYGGGQPNTSDDRLKRWKSLDPRHSIAACENAVAYLQGWTMNVENISIVGFEEGGKLAVDVALAESDPHLRAVVDVAAPLSENERQSKALRNRLLMEPTVGDNYGNAIAFLKARQLKD